MKFALYSVVTKYWVLESIFPFDQIKMMIKENELQIPNRPIC